MGGEGRREAGWVLHVILAGDLHGVWRFMGSALFCCEGNLAGSFVGLCKGVGGDL